MRGLIPHPWLFGLSLLSWLLLIVYLVLAVLFPSKTPPSALAVVVGGFLIVFLVSWISGIVIAVLGRLWVWLIVLIVTLGYGVIFFSIFARPRQQIT